jgi:hypothetical protein
MLSRLYHDYASFLSFIEELRIVIEQMSSPHPRRIANRTAYWIVRFSSAVLGPFRGFPTIEEFHSLLWPRSRRLRQLIQDEALSYVNAISQRKNIGLGRKVSRYSQYAKIAPNRK